MAGDPDWGAIDALAALIRSEAAAVALADAAEVFLALREVTDEVLDDVARMELMWCRLKTEDPGLQSCIPHGVAVARRRVQLLLELQRRLTTSQPSAG